MGQAGDKTHEDKGGYDDDKQGLGQNWGLGISGLWKAEVLVTEDLETKLCICHTV